MPRTLRVGMLLVLTACATGGSDGSSQMGDSAVTTPGEGDSGLGTPVPATGDDSGGPAVSSDSGTPARDSGATAVDSGSPTMNGDGAVDGGGGVPTTCAEANGEVGCCGPNGEAYYCATSSGTTVKSTACTGGKVCGWDASKMYYTCVSPPGGGDPSGMEPMACGGGAPVDSGTAPDSGDAASHPDSGEAGPEGDAADAMGMDAADAMGVDAADAADAADTQPANQTPTTCAEADGLVGCCGPNGDVYYCASDAMPVISTKCSASKVCGWNATQSYYDCVAPPATADPSGTYPMSCL
jgi:hypothetical protein